jgi:hypothetical protein
MGVHGAGAAKHAKEYYGAIMGKPEGLQGQSYAIPTKYTAKGTAMSLEEIKEGVIRFLEYAKNNPDTRFYLTPIGTGLAGYKHSDIAPMFKGVSSNVQIPTVWIDYLIERT